MTLGALALRWGALSPAIRRVLAIALAGLVVASIAGVAIAQRPRGALFATPLHPEQLTEVEERLADWNVPFTPTADNLIVDARRRGDLLLRLSLADVPHAHVATSDQTLASIGALTPQSVIDAQTRAGLAGDIEVALRGIDGVDDAQVIVAPAKAADFADETPAQASASVRLRLRDGTALSADAVQGIRQFVGASVAGLDPAHVTIVDDRGIALGSSNDSGDDADALRGSLQSALDQALGAGAAIVRVRAERDAREIATHDVRDAPLGTLTSTGSDESYRDGNKNYDKRQRDETRGTETRDVATTLPAGRIARLSVAVFVDARRTVDLVAIRQLAAASVGLDERRGDTLTVEAVDFARDTVAAKDGWWLAYGTIVPLLPTVALVLGGLCALRYCAPHAGELIRTCVERAGIAQTKVAVEGFTPTQVAGVLRDEPPHAAAAVISALPAATAAAVLDLYPAHERAAIVRRMQRERAPVVPHAREIVDRV
ncbi:MAG TPA: flagellar M-ring protein FliF C-terminal domain-containing protein [Verrucomicrobiae bacterium]|nr:flagellar M-ring protein FliF C-terminal domain-containing protein [Verrucomicrobiae bacterium]